MRAPRPEGPFGAVLARGLGPGAPRLVHVRREPGRDPVTAPLPGDLRPELVDALARTGVTSLYAHQATAFRRAREGAHIALVTGTASGKTLGYGLPVLQGLLDDPHARALYLAPTKALAQDQARRLHALGLAGLRLALYDGDTDRPERGRARREANLLLTNPDMVHLGICGRAERWGDVLANLSAVVIDEAHVYRGVFGAHVANVVRRLRRLAAIHGSAPQLLLASATIANPEEALAALVGAELEVIRDDASAQPPRTLAVWNPELIDPDAGERRSALQDAAELVAALVVDGRRVIAFARSRRGVEVLAQDVARRLDGPLARRVTPYRAGYTAEQRRDLERRLADGELLAVVATSALELGIDVGLLDACVVVGYPGTIAGLRQRFGRAGRIGEGLAVLVCGADPLDQFLARDPERLLGAPVEAAVVDHASPEILRAHLACAAAEAPLAARDAALLGPSALALGEELVDAGELARTPRGLAWALPTSPHSAVSLRSASADAITIVDGTSGLVLGTADAERAPRTLHAGAIYLHLGAAYLVESLDLEERLALLAPFPGDWTTEASSEQLLDLGDRFAGAPLPIGEAVLAPAVVTERVVGYRRRRLRDGQVLGSYRLELPARVFPTDALALVLDVAALRDLADLHGALHAAEHALAAVLPLRAACDPADVIGLSAALLPATGAPTVVVYDAHVGGVGLVRRAFAELGPIVRDAHRLVAGCPCASGCPACIQSPRCERANEPLAKDDARALLAALAGA